MVIKTFYRTRLPHLVPIGATFFVTFRLADSLPQKLVRALQAQRKAELKILRERKPKGYRRLIEEVHQKYFAKYEHQLDEKPYGNCYLRQPKVAQIVADRLHELDGKFYELQAYCIMPNHVHILISTAIQLEQIDIDLQPEAYTELWKIMHRIKGYSSRKCNELLGREGAFWFKDNYDHYVRNFHSWERIRNYIVQNPVKAGLAKNWRDWKFTFSTVGIQADESRTVDFQVDESRTVDFQVDDTSLDDFKSSPRTVDLKVDATMKTTQHTNELIQHAILRLDENTDKIKKCLRELTEEELWRRPNAASNSVGNLLLHLSGNIRQYAISSLGGQPDVRQRDAEFAVQEGYTKTELFAKLSATVEEAIAVLKSTGEEEMLKVRFVQGYEFSGIGIVVHVVEHYSYHTGQIAFWTKLLRNRDLGFYADIDLNVKNE